MSRPLAPAPSLPSGAILADFVEQLETTMSDPAPVQRADDEDARERAKARLVPFNVYASGGRWQPARHLELLAEKLEAVERGEILRLIISMPPRHGKSEQTSFYFPAWYAGRNPDKRIIITGYGDELATTFGRRTRNLLSEIGPPLFGIRVAGDSSAAGRWDIAGHEGGMVATGILGGLTGKGAHLLIIDDPFKNWEEASSPTTRQKVWDEYQATLRTRLAPGGAIVVIMTRWNEDDLVGRLLKAEAEGTGEHWEVLRLPALAEENDPLGRAPGEALWPEKFPAHDIQATMSVLHSVKASALYQQRPSPAKGKYFKREDFLYARVDGEYLLLPKQQGSEWVDVRVRLADCTKVQMVDTAASLKTSADHFVVETWLATPTSDLILWDVFRTRIEGPDQARLMRDQYDNHKPHTQFVESKTFGLTLFQSMVRDGLPVRPLEARGDKVSRVLPIAARYESKTVYHRAGAPWVQAYEDELIKFTGADGGEDDQVDCAAYAGIWLADRLGQQPVSDSHQVTYNQLLGKPEEDSGDMPDWMLPRR